MGSLRQAAKIESLAGATDLISPLPKYSVGKIAWKCAVAALYAFAIFCTVVSLVALRLTGFTPDMVLPLLFWNVVPWVFAYQIARRARVARATITQAEAQAVARRMVLAQAVEAANAKIAASSPQSTPTVRGRRHWWTDTALREENKIIVGQK